MLRVTQSKKTKISLYVATAVVMLIGFADLWRGGTTVSAFMLAIGYCVLIPLVIWSGAAGDVGHQRIHRGGVHVRPAASAGESVLRHHRPRLLAVADRRHGRGAHQRPR